MPCHAVSNIDAFGLPSVCYEAAVKLFENFIHNKILLSLSENGMQNESDTFVMNMRNFQSKLVFRCVSETMYISSCDLA